jgi:hypothetical protein
MALSLTSTLQQVVDAFVVQDPPHALETPLVSQFGNQLSLTWVDTSKVDLAISTRSLTPSGVRLIGPAPPPPPIVAQAFAPTVSSQYIQNLAGVTPYGDISMSAWVYFQGAPGNVSSGVHGFICTFDQNNSQYLLVFDSSFETKAQSYNSSTVSAGYNLDPDTFGSPQNNKWYHVAGVFDSGGVPGQVVSSSVYVKGSANVNTGTGLANQFTNTNSPTLGTFISQTANTYVAYPAIWKSKLSLAQVDALAAHADPRTINTGTLASFCMGNTAAGKMVDLYGTGYTITGAVTFMAPPFILT